MTCLPACPAPASGLSAPLKTELVLFLYRDVLRRVPFFRGKSTLFIASVVPHLHLDYFSAVRASSSKGSAGTLMPVRACLRMATCDCALATKDGCCTGRGSMLQVPCGASHIPDLNPAENSHSLWCAGPCQHACMCEAQVRAGTCMSSRCAPQGEVVVRQGDPGNVMYFVAEGQLEVRLYTKAPTGGAAGSASFSSRSSRSSKRRPHSPFKASDTPRPRSEVDLGLQEGRAECEWLAGASGAPARAAL